MIVFFNTDPYHQAFLKIFFTKLAYYQSRFYFRFLQSTEVVFQIENRLDVPVQAVSGNRRFTRFSDV